MSKQLPEDWINETPPLNVFTDLGLKCDVTNLFIYKHCGLKTHNLYWRWKSLNEEDYIRANSGRTTDLKGNVALEKNGKKKKECTTDKNRQVKVTLSQQLKKQYFY